MPISVFIAYADSYVGEQLVRQFEGKPQLFTIQGCTWEEDAAHALAAKAIEKYQLQLMSTQQQQQKQQPSVRRSSDSGVIKDSIQTAPLSTAAASTSGVLNEAANTVGTGTLSHPHRPSGTSTPKSTGVGVSMSGDFSRHAGGTANELCATSVVGSRSKTQVPNYFCRRDVAATRRALLSSDWIIVEQRQAQDIFDMLHCLQETPFDKPKRFILLSNFMTWYATPPLALPEDMNEEEEEDMMADDEDMLDEEDDELQMPYPPPPEEKEEAGPESDDEEADEAEDGAEPKEVLTEDQYNRRIPHVRYFNFRDAEKAVAAAHHAKGLPLDTFVVFAGLPYGEGECALEPFFRCAWSADPNASLPIFGDGNQRVPMIHVRDLATFTRKLLRCPTDELPNSTARYLFATDGSRLSWRTIIETINKMFGGRCTYRAVTPEQVPLHRDAELFSINLRVENETIQAIMEREDPTPEEGRTEGIQVHHDSNGHGQTWIAQGGIKQALEKVSLEFRAVRRVTPLRVAFLGPPMVGKTYLSTMLAAHYKLPRFRMDDIVAAYKASLASLQEQIRQYRETLIEGEKERRLAIKKRRLLRAKRKSAAAMEEEDEELAVDEEDGLHDEDETIPSKTDPTVAPVLPILPPIREESEDDVEEREEVEFGLTEEEIREAVELMEERFESSAKVEKLRNEVAQMERILLMRVRPRPPTPDANPKKRVNQPKKKLTKEQQRKKEEEELQQAKEALKDAPFQDKALALMFRWRVAQPDCRNQGFLLDGCPATVELARLCFSSEELIPPMTEEEALAPPLPPPVPAPKNDDDEDEDPLPPSEPSDGHRLPDCIIVLSAEENYLLDRFTAVSHMHQTLMVEEQEEAPSCSAREVSCSQELSQLTSRRSLSPSIELQVANPVPEVEPVKTDAVHALSHFHESMAVFNHEFIEAPYSMLSYFECAFTVPDDTAPGGRRAQMHLLRVQEVEPLVPPPPPASPYEEVPPTSTEVSIREILGDAHNFGKTPEELHQEEVRRQLLEEEKRQAKIKAEQEQRKREGEAFSRESAIRNQIDTQLLEVKKQDYAALESRKLVLRDYLQKSVLPLLSKGLIEVCARRPEDPVDFLAEWLMRHNPHEDIFCDL